MTYAPAVSATGFWEGKDKPYHTCSDALCNWIANYFGTNKDKQIYDFGCGSGQYLRRLRDAGFTKLTGFEGSVPENAEFDNIVQQDLTISLNLPHQGNCIFSEVAEHVPAQFEDILLSNITNACDDKLVMSWAIRGQAGHGHVNCLNSDEAIERMVKNGFIYLPDETAEARAVILDGDLPWFKNTLLVFNK